MYIINCRAKVSGGCLDGDPTTDQFGADEPMSEDETFRLSPGGGSIVCDNCRIRLMPLTPSGSGLNEELDDAIIQFHMNVSLPS